MSATPPPMQPINYASPTSVTPRKPSFFRGVIGWMIFVGVAIMFFLLMRQGRSAGAPMVSFGQLQKDVMGGNVRQVDVMSDELEYTVFTPSTLTSPANSRVQASSTLTSTTYRVRLATGMGQDFEFIRWLAESRGNAAGPDIQFRSEQNLVVNLLLPLIPWLLIFGFIYFFVFRVLRKQQANLRPTPVVIVNPEALRQ